jgi:hypothetical protein
MVLQTSKKNNEKHSFYHLNDLQWGTGVLLHTVGYFCINLGTPNQSTGLVPVRLEASCYDGMSVLSPTQNVCATQVLHNEVLPLIVKWITRENPSML